MEQRHLFNSRVPSFGGLAQQRTLCFQGMFQWAVIVKCLFSSMLSSVSCTTSKTHGGWNTHVLKCSIDLFWSELWCWKGMSLGLRKLSEKQGVTLNISNWTLAPIETLSAKYPDGNNSIHRPGLAAFWLTLTFWFVCPSSCRFWEVNNA